MRGREVRSALESDGLQGSVTSGLLTPSVLCSLVQTTQTAQTWDSDSEGRGGAVCVKVGGRNSLALAWFSRGKPVVVGWFGGDSLGETLVSVSLQLLHTPAHVLPSAAFLCSLFVNSLLLATEARR